MGMFDYLICQRQLPIPYELKDCRVDWDREVFQTKSLDKLLFTYLISKDGCLFRDANPKKVAEDSAIPFSTGLAFNFHEDNWGLDYPGKERANGLEDALALIDYKIDYHGYIIFYTIIHDLKHEDLNEDCRVEFIAKFTDGKLQNIEFKKLDRYRAISECKKSHLVKKRGFLGNFIVETGLFLSRISHKIIKLGYWI
jgi:hypothetical protein